jgi:hypothetical protein
MRQRNKTIVLIFFVVIGLAPAMQAQDLYTYEKSLEFANYLHQTGEYELAATEYKRLFFADKTNELVNTRLLDCFWNTTNYEKIIFYSRMMDSSQVMNNLKLRTYYLKSGFLVNPSAITMQSYNTLQISTSEKTYYTLSSKLLNKQWDAAKSYRSSCSDQLLQTYSPVFAQIEQTQFKKQWLAMSMSAVIPGSGKAYAGYWKDGLMSLVIIGVSAWQASRGFEQDGVKSAYGWIYAGVGMGFYLGNLYGTAKALNKKNNYLNDAIYHKTEHIFKTPYFY